MCVCERERERERERARERETARGPSVMMKGRVICTTSIRSRVLV